MEVVVYKTHQDLDRSSSREPGLRCILYEARTLQSMRSQRADEQKLCERLKAENPKMALAQIIEPLSESTQLSETKCSKSSQGSYACYQLSTTEDISKCTAIFLLYPGLTQATLTITQLMLIQDSHSTEEFAVPDEIAAIEKALLEKLSVDEEKIKDMEAGKKVQIYSLKLWLNQCKEKES